MPVPTDQQLEAFQNDQDAFSNDQDVTTHIVNEIKSSAFQDYRWESLLQAVPTSISSLGSCLVASTSPNAVVMLTETKKWQYLKYPTVRANLVQCANLGKDAFIEADVSMSRIKLESDAIFGKINDVMMCIGDPETAQKSLRPNMNAVKRSADRCHEKAEAMSAKFDYWLAHANELHETCVATEDVTREKYLSTQISVAAAQTRLDTQIDTVKQVEVVQTQLKSSLDVTTAAFKRASDNFPTGWDIVGQQIVSKLADCATTAISQVIPALIDNMNPMARVKAGTDILGDVVHMGEELVDELDGDEGDDNEDSRKHGKPKHNANGSGGDDKDGKRPKRPQKPMQDYKTRPEDSDDPAYALVIKDITNIDMLAVALHGKNGAVNWVKAKGEVNQLDAHATVTYLKEVLSDANEVFEKNKTDTDVSGKLSTVLQVMSQIATELADELDQSAKDAKYKLPDENSDKVKDWQKKYTEQAGIAHKIHSTAKRLQGTAHRVPFAADADPSAQSQKVQADTDQAAAILEAGKNMLATTQDAMLSTQKNLITSTQLLTEQQNLLGTIQENLKQLTSASMTLAETRAILVECIKLVLVLKEQVTNLVRFFRSIGTVIEFVVDMHVKDFLESIDAIVSNGGVDPRGDLKIGPYTWTATQRTMLFSIALTLRAYFSIFYDIAKMWKQISDENVWPGFKLIGEMSNSAATQEDVVKKAGALQAWSTEASTRVFNVAKAKQSSILEGLKTRVGTLGKTTAKMPEVAPTIKQNITAGVQVPEKAVEKGLMQRAKNNPMAKFAPIKDE